MYSFCNVFIICAICAVTVCAAPTESKTYWSLEHPGVTYFNTEYITEVNVSSRRFGRADPYHYLSLNFVAMDGFANNLTLHFYFFELLSNTYKRGFVEVHVKLCDFIHKDNFLGPSLKNTQLDKPCPFPAGPYNLVNMSIPLLMIPRGFPFTKGRIYLNLTLLPSHTQKETIIASGYVDMELKQMRNAPKSTIKLASFKL